MYCPICEKDPCKFGDPTFEMIMKAANPKFKVQVEDALPPSVTAGPPMDARPSKDPDPDGLLQPGFNSQLAQDMDVAFDVLDDHHNDIEAIRVNIDALHDRVCALEGAKPVGFYAKVMGDGSLVINHVAVRHATKAFWDALGVDPERIGISTKAEKGRYILQGIDLKGEKL